MNPGDDHFSIWGKNPSHIEYNDDVSSRMEQLLKNNQSSAVALP